MKKRMIEYSEKDSLALMRNPSDWGCWPILPLKNRRKKGADGLSLLGFMCEGPGQQAAPKVYVGSIYFRDMGKKIEDLPVMNYANLEAAVAAGWEVD